MDLFTASTTLSAVSLALSGALGALSIKSLIRARNAEMESNDRALDVAARLGSELQRTQRELISKQARTIFDQDDVIDDYRVKLIESEENVQGLSLALAMSGGVVVAQQESIAQKNTEIALLDEELDEIEVILRRIHPELPDDVPMSEAVETIFESIVASGYAETYGGQENEKGVIARVIEKLADENEAANELLDMQGHQLQVFQGVFETQGEIIQELRDEKALAEQELAATKTVANDDSADADRYANDLAQSDALAVRLLAELSRTSIGYSLTEEEQAALIGVQLRHDVRTRRPQQPGAVGTEAQLAA